jgi:hypothetical protein
MGDLVVDAFVVEISEGAFGDVLTVVVLCFYMDLLLQL